MVGEIVKKPGDLLIMADSNDTGFPVYRWFEPTSHDITDRKYFMVPQQTVCLVVAQLTADRRDKSQLDWLCILACGRLGWIHADWAREVK